MKQFQESLDDYDKAVQIDPQFAKAFYNRGFVYRDVEQPEQACTDWKKACELGFANGCGAVRTNCNAGNEAQEAIPEQPEAEDDSEQIPSSEP